MFIVIAVILTAVILAIFLEEVFFMFSNAKMRDWKLKDKALVLLGIYPVSIKQSTCIFNSQPKKEFQVVKSHDSLN